MNAEESLCVTFDESPLLPKTSSLEDDDLVKKEAIKAREKKPLGNDVEDEVLENDEIININESKTKLATTREEAVPEHNVVKTYKNTTPRKPKDIWIAIERLQQGESLNKQDVKTNLFWEFSKFTSRDEESIESYYLRFCKMMNEMIKNKLEVATMHINITALTKCVNFAIATRGKMKKTNTMIVDIEDNNLLAAVKALNYILEALLKSMILTTTTEL
nr:hypothetical protein [Tanacetum cinerariifolium]